MPNSNTYYTAYGVLKKYLSDRGYTIVNFSLQHQAVDRIEMWVEPTGDAAPVNFVCVKMSPTQFLIWGYKNDYTQVVSTGYNFADVNTPSMLNTDRPAYTNEEPTE